MGLDPKRAVEAYTEAWNDVSGERRRQLLEECWADGGVYCDPLSLVTGREALAGHIASFGERMPGHSIQLTTGADAHDGFARFGWGMFGPEGELVTEGMDFVVLDDDGRIARIVGFFGPMPDLAQPSA